MLQVRAIRGRRPAGTVVPALFTLVAGAALPAGAASAAHAQAQQARAVSLFMVPGIRHGAAPVADEDGTAAHPFTSIAQAERPAHQLSADANVVVHLAAGRYRLTRPLRFTSSDSALNHHTITYRGAPAAGTVVSGSQRVTSWTVQNSGSNIWVANVGVGANTRAAIRQRGGGAAGSHAGTPH
jgi:hypothetical protein